MGLKHWVCFGFVFLCMQNLDSSGLHKLRNDGGEIGSSSKVL